jgi:protein ImuB
LQARLGVEQVQRLAAVEDHRPERASRLGTGAAPVRAARSSQRGARCIAEPFADEVAMAASSCPRPVWLQRPEPLAERNARPLLEGCPLALLSGPERIESGWWDAELAERDYFIAEADDGALVWIYRARLPLSASGASGWFLHGRFG